MVAICAALGGCAASTQEVVARLGDHYIGQSIDQIVVDWGPPANSFKMTNGDTSYVWQLGNQTNAAGGNGSAIASTRFCKVSVVANKAGIVTLLNTEDSNAGGGFGGAMGAYGSICANRLGIQRDRP